MRSFSSIIVASLSLVSAVHAQATDSSQCAKTLHIIAARGHGTAAGYGGLNLTVAAIRNAVRGVTSFPVPYYTYPSPSGYNFQAEAANGTRIMTTNVKEYVRSCPNTPIVLLGYSEGAVIMMNLLCGASSAGFNTTDPFPSSYAKNIIAIIALGDETRTLNQAYNIGTCTNGYGMLPRRTPEGCAAFAPVIQSYCDSPDPECCGGNNETVHHYYPQEYDDQIAAYVSQQYMTYLNTTGSSNSTSSSNTKPKAKGS